MSDKLPLSDTIIAPTFYGCKVDQLRQVGYARWRSRNSRGRSPHPLPEHLGEVARAREADAACDLAVKNLPEPVMAPFEVGVQSGCRVG